MEKEGTEKGRTVKKQLKRNRLEFRVVICRQYKGVYGLRIVTLAERQEETQERTENNLTV